MTGTVRKEASSTYVTDATAGLSPQLANVAWGNGKYLSGKVQPNAYAVAGGVLYKLDNHSSLFANGSRGFFMPQMNTVQINAANETQSFEAEIIKQAEAGYKYASSFISGSIAGFYSTLANRRNINFINGATAGSAPVEVINVISTRSYGTEATLDVRIWGGLSFEGNATYEHDIYTKYTPVAACTDCVGNTMQRQPNVLGNLGLYYKDSLFDAALFRFLHGPDVHIGPEQHRAAELPHRPTGRGLHPHILGRRSGTDRGQRLQSVRQHSGLGGLASPRHAAERRPGLFHRPAGASAAHHGSIVL